MRQPWKHEVTKGRADGRADSSIYVILRQGQKVLFKEISLKKTLNFFEP